MDIVRSNFEQVLPKVVKALNQSDFIAIDAEFTGLAAYENQRPSFFDSPCERYKKLKKMVSQFLTCQIGISAFLKSEKYPNTYEAHTFNFYLYPSSFGQIDSRFMCQASSLEFLCNHKFDFNKFVYEGVPFLNRTQKVELQELCMKNQVKIASALNKDIDRNFLIPLRKKIEEWLLEKKRDALVLECPGAFLQFILYQEVLKKFDKLRCEVQTEGKLLLKRQTNSEKELFDYSEQIEKIVLQSCGFMRIFELLIKLKKPLVGHNLFADLLFMYEKFYDTLPDDYNVFKRNIHQLFPYIFDTKRLAYALSKDEMLKETDIFKRTNLEELYAELSSHKGLYFVLYTPTIVHSNNTQKYVQSHSMHEAGYDSFISGYVFLRMVHILTAKTIGSSMDGPLEFDQYFETVKSHGNFVNLSRGSVHCLNLAGEDPTSIRPYWLHVSRRRSFERLTAAEILKKLDKFGSLDVRILDNRRALVATGHSKVSQRIVAAFRRNKTLRIRKYYPIIDCPRMRTIMWAGVVTTVFTLVFGGIAAVYYGKQKVQT